MKTFLMVGLSLIFIIVLLYCYDFITDYNENVLTELDIVESNQMIIKNKLNSINKAIKEQKEYEKKQKAKEKKIINNIKFIIHKVNLQLDDKEVNYLAEVFYRVSKEEKVPLPILISVAWQESSFSPNVVSKSGCIGIMQVNPKVWKGIPVSLLYQIDVNIRVGAYILYYYYKQTHCWNRALFRYYGVSNFGKVYEKNVLRKAKVVNKQIKA